MKPCLALATLFALVTSQSSTTFLEQWTTFRHDASNSGYSNVSGPTSSQNINNFTQGFCAKPLFPESPTSPAIPFVVASAKYPGVLYGGDSQNRLWTMRETNNAWTASFLSLADIFPGLQPATPSGVVSAPTAAINDAGAEVVVVASADGHVGIFFLGVYTPSHFFFFFF